MTFTQAQIKIGNEPAFGEFKSVLERAFSAASVEGFLKSVSKRGLQARQFEQIRDAGLLDRFRDGKSVGELWQQLTVADQSLVREAYLTKVEEVGPEVRRKFARLYQYT
jgi:hypothetical protein